jgi:DNA invertase Pin-like site-specific DNA recombinase
MLPKQNNYNVGIYLRLSKDDERQGESLSIENQRRVLTNYVNEQGWSIYNEYVDDGISGVSFDRPGVQRMLEDAKFGKINLIICKDMSRFGRNYIQVGQYIDYLFPMYNIRFIALTDNIDTLNSDSASMDMLPIMNVFNEWYAANTSKKLRAVFESNAKSGKYKCTYCAYGYFKSDDGFNTPIIDPYAAVIVHRIFEMRANGFNPKKIADILNSEHIPTPSDYQYQRLGRPNPHNTSHLWGNINVKRILNNPIYLGKLAQLRTTSVSYKNHKIIQKSEEDWAVVENNHEPIITQELWDKCREVDKSVSQGKRDKKGVTAPLSGFLYCDSCGSKMRQHNGGKGQKPAFACGLHSRCGGDVCSTHYIKQYLIEETVLADIQDKSRMVLCETDAKAKFLAYKSKQQIAYSVEEKKRETEVKKRLDELDRLIQNIYEDKVLGKVPEDVCIGLLEKYSAEKKSLSAEYDTIMEHETVLRQDEADVDEFMSRLRKYAGATELTREMCLDLIGYVTVDENTKDRTKPRKIHIYYKFLDKELADKHNALA